MIGESFWDIDIPDIVIWGATIVALLSIIVASLYGRSVHVDGEAYGEDPGGCCLSFFTLPVTLGVPLLVSSFCGEMLQMLVLLICWVVSIYLALIPGEGRAWLQRVSFVEKLMNIDGNGLRMTKGLFIYPGWGTFIEHRYNYSRKGMIKKVTALLRPDYWSISPDDYPEDCEYSEDSFFYDSSKGVTFNEEGYVCCWRSGWQYGEYENRMEFQYDGDGHITEVRHKTAWWCGNDPNKETIDKELTEVYEWKDGLLVSGSTFMRWEIEYSDLENKYRQQVFYPYFGDEIPCLPIALFGVGPKKLPSRITFDGGETLDLKFKIDESGKIVSCKTSKKTYGYKYQKIGGKAEEPKEQKGADGKSKKGKSRKGRGRKKSLRSRLYGIIWKQLKKRFK